MAHLVSVFTVVNVLYFVEIIFVELSDKTCEIGMVVQPRKDGFSEYLNILRKRDKSDLDSRKNEIYTP